MHWALGFQSLDINSRRSLYFWHYQSMHVCSYIQSSISIIPLYVKMQRRLAKSLTGIYLIGYFCVEISGIRYSVINDVGFFLIGRFQDLKFETPSRVAKVVRIHNDLLTKWRPIYTYMSKFHTNIFLMQTTSY